MLKIIRIILVLGCLYAMGTFLGLHSGKNEVDYIAEISEPTLTSDGCLEFQNPSNYSLNYFERKKWRPEGAFFILFLLVIIQFFCEKICDITIENKWYQLLGNKYYYIAFFLMGVAAGFSIALNKFVVIESLEPIIVNLPGLQQKTHQYGIIVITAIILMTISMMIEGLINRTTKQVKQEKHQRKKRRRHSY